MKDLPQVVTTISLLLSYVWASLAKREADSDCFKSLPSSLPLLHPLTLDKIEALEVGASVGTHCRIHLS